MKNEFFLVIMQRVVVILDRPFGTTYRVLSSRNGFWRWERQVVSKHW